MKQLMGFLLLAATASCSGANDGNAKTDTTTMPVDTAIYQNQVNTQNRADGTRVGDSTMRDSIHMPQ